uniref:Uncharacterized protein AlNc14C149G7471 n=1 Tax=Albugo laibachii Nc14 TaxID=890382 RepID=F0WLV8_9STRA|nr:conserved hypothetical protein [Albugo laibachii Nc14]|eukprot:CCA22284.1 conserved hypothetical protein [Albugo laibachii Nc14]
MRRGNSILIFASEVPVITGKNPFRTIEDTFFHIWKRTSPLQIEQLQQDHQLEKWQSKEEKIFTKIEQLGMKDSVSALISEASKAETAPEISKVSAKIAAVIPEKVPVIARKEIERTIVSEMHKEFGTRQESAAIEHFEKDRGVQVKERNLAFHKRHLSTTERYQVYLGGRIDGRNYGKVVEVKNRLRQFLSPIPIYDIVQLQTYLYILSSKEGELVEYMKQDRAKSRQTQIDWDPAMWSNDIEPYLLRFSNALTLFMKSKDCQVRFLKSTCPLEQRDLIKTYWSRTL